MFLTGTVSYFKDELSQWMRPELPHQAQVPDRAAVAQRVADGLGAVAPGSTQWSMRLPDARNNSVRSEEHTSELQSLMRISYAVFCLKKKKHYYCTQIQLA